MRHTRIILAFALVTAALLAGRVVHLGADVPPWYLPNDSGFILDDGYKTLSARNVAEFGATHWHPDDRYAGWSAKSPLTHWSYVLAFEIGGTRVSSPRSVVVLFFTMTVAAFVITFRRVYPPWAILFGVLLLSLEPTLYHFSRTALFEVTLSFFTCLGLFSLYVLRNRGTFLPVTAIGIFGALGTLLVKPSGLIYVAPALFAVPLGAFVTHGIDRRKALVLVGSLAGVTVLLLLNQNAWKYRLALDEIALVPRKLLTSGPSEFTPVVVLAALLCLAHGLATRPAQYLSDRYRLALVSILLGVPLLLALFQDLFPRYYVAMIAVAPLLVADHFGRGAWRWTREERTPVWSRLAVGAVSVLVVWYALRAANHVVLERLPFDIGDTPGVLAVTMYRYFAPVAIVSFAIGATMTSWLGRPRFFRPVLALALFVFLVLGIGTQVRTVTAPTYDAQRIRERIVEITDPEATFIGCWAPLLTLGTERRVLFATDWLNPPEVFGELGVDYFLWVDAWYDRMNLATLRELGHPALGPPVPLGRMRGKEVVLYPLRQDGETLGH